MRRDDPSGTTLKPRPWMALAALVAVLLLAPPEAGPGAKESKRAAEAPRGPVERATVELVLIEAYVTDSAGRPVRGLGQGDFVLQVDGKVRPISSVEFREIQTAERAPGTAPRAAPAEAPSARTPALLPRRFILFFEDATSTPIGQAAARRAAEGFITDRLSPADQVALASYDRKLRVLQEFTADRADLKAALRRSLDDRGRVSDFAAELTRRQEQIRAVLPRGDEEAERVAEARLLAMDYATEDAARMRAILSALRVLVSALGPWPGYKALVFLGDGIPGDPLALYADQLVTPGLSAEATTDLSQDIKTLAHQAAATGVTFHSVQTSGLVAGQAHEVRASLRRANSLETLAFNTGGTTSSSNDLLKGLTQAGDASRAYYVIGYEPEGEPDGLDHSVQLRVKRGGHQLRWRRVFTRLRPSEARVRAVEAAHLLPELYPEMQIEIASVRGPRSGEDRVCDLVLHLRRDRVLFLPEEGRPTAHLEIGLVALEDGGREALRLARQTQIALQPGLGTKAGLGLNFFTRVHLPRASLTMTAVITDLSSGTIGATRIVLPAGPEEEREVLGLSIYSLDESSLWIELDASGRPQEGSGTPTEYTVGPALRSRYAVGESLACGFRLKRPHEAGEAALRLAVRPADADDPGAIRTIEVTPVEGGGAVTSPLPVAGLPAGSYRLVVQEVRAGKAVDLESLLFSLRAVAAGTGSGL